jgi:dynein heavy chain
LAGVLAKVMREVCGDESLTEKWLLLDGPVDTLWIESMNTVLDDNKLLTLINGERIAMPPQVSLLFEVEDLSVASPATVSRAGMVYVDDSDMGWKPYVDRMLIASDCLPHHWKPYVDCMLMASERMLMASDCL